MLSSQTAQRVYHSNLLELIKIVPHRVYSNGQTIALHLFDYTWTGSAWVTLLGEEKSQADPRSWSIFKLTFYFPMSHCKSVPATAFPVAKCSKMDTFLPEGGGVQEETGESNFPVSIQRTTSGLSLFQKHPKAPWEPCHWLLININSVLNSAGGKEEPSPLFDTAVN